MAGARAPAPAVRRRAPPGGRRPAETGRPAVGLGTLLPRACRAAYEPVPSGPAHTLRGMPEAAAFLSPRPVDPSRPDVALRAVPGAAPPAPALELPPYDLMAALELERELGVSHVLAQVLVRRGLSDVGAARAFLHPTETHEPSAFAGIERAVALIERHIRNGSRIIVHGDYDVDGVCATATMVRGLRALGADVG